MDLSGDGLATLISPITGLMALSIGFYLIRQKNKRPETKVAIFLTLVISLGAFLDFAMGMAPDETTAREIGRAVIFLVEIIMGTLLYLALMQLPQKISERVFQYKRELQIVIVFIAVIAAAFITEMAHDQWGYSINSSNGLNLAIAIYLVYISISIIVMMWSSGQSEDRTFRKKAVLMSIALPMPLMYSFGTSFIESLTEFQIPRLLMPGFTIMVLLVAYAIVRYKLFIDVPTVSESEPLVSSHTKTITQLGKTYLVEGQRTTRAYEMLIDDLSRGYHGLIITREHPDIVRESRGLSSTPILWLSSQPGKDRIDPTNLSILQHTITEHLRKGESPVIFMDGLEYLLANNKVEKVLQLVLLLRDEIIVHNGKLIVPVDPRTMDLKILAFFERDLEVVVHAE